MKYKTRLAIMLGFIITFLVGAPVLLFYSSGYRIDFQKNQLIQTGTLFIKTPDIHEAIVFINNKEYPENLNEKLFIYNMLPGEYDVKISKEGYYDWQKTLTITSNLTTFADNTTLIKKSSSEKVLAGDITEFYPSPDNSTIAYTIATKTLHEIYTLKLHEESAPELLYQTPREITSLSWAPSSKKLLIEKDNGTHTVIGINGTSQEIPIEITYSQNFEYLTWDDFSDDTLFGLNKNSIFKLGLSFETIEKIPIQTPSLTTTIIPPLTVIDSSLYYFVQKNGEKVLKRYSFLVNATQELYTTSSSFDFEFIQSPNNFLTILDSQKEKAVIVTLTQSPDISFSREQIKTLSAEEIVWDEKFQQLFFFTHFEISLYDPAQNSITLINRYGKKINQVAWHPDLNTLLIAFEDTIEIIDILTVNGTRNVTEIVQAQTIFDFLLFDNAKKLLFSGTIEEEQGLYELILSE